MKDLSDILQRLRPRKDKLPDAVVATLVHTVGSSYRTPGARLLMEDDGTLTGVLSGGCLEADIAERAKKVRASGRSELITYDTSSAQDIVDGLGIGCNGKIQVLLEPGSAAAPSLQFADVVLEKGGRGVIATIFHVRGFPDVRLGARLLLDDAGESFHGVPDSALQKVLSTQARSFLREATTATQSLELGVEIADVLFEVIAPPPSLAIFGTGPGSSALAHLAKQLGWRVTVLDHRDKASHRREFASVDRMVIGDYAQIRRSLDLTPSLAAVVMSHNFEADLEYLRMLLPSPVQYIGLLGSRNRSEELLSTLFKEGMRPESVRERLFNPVGLDIGAEGPEEIALAILSEIRAVAAHRTGGFLKDRKGPIHEPHAPLGTR